MTEKTVYFVSPDELGYAFVARNEEEARKYAEEKMECDVDLAECHQVKRDREPVILPEKEFGYKVPLREGLLKGVYSFATDLSCENCDDPSGYVVEHDGKIVCDKCKAKLKKSNGEAPS